MLLVDVRLGEFLGAIMVVFLGTAMAGDVNINAIAPHQRRPVRGASDLAGQARGRCQVYAVQNT